MRTNAFREEPIAD